MRGSRASPTIIQTDLLTGAALLKLLKWNIILLVKTPIIFESLNKVCKQNT